jgi:hypothetical protein
MVAIIMGKFHIFLVTASKFERQWAGKKKEFIVFLMAKNWVNFNFTLYLGHWVNSMAKNDVTEGATDNLAASNNFEFL